MAPRKTTKGEKPASSETSTRKKRKQQDGARETVESIAIAFVLAFLFKTFQAEAYVIPTGSMAPTLYGRHKEVECEACGFEFAVGASSEIDQFSGMLIARVEEAFCVNCGYRNNAMEAPVFNGDRILVNKQIDEFRRFDVVVFKNPEEAHVNYIKRLVGLPNERIRIRKGDIWALAEGADAWQVQRKENPDVQNAIQLMVHDDRFPAVPLLKLGWPERWVPAANGNGSDSVGGWIPVEDNGWSADRTTREYSFANNGEDVKWLRYRHMQPGNEVWTAAINGEALPRPEARLISDFCSFNAYNGTGYFPQRHQMLFDGGIYWVGDLTVEFQLDIQPMEGSSSCVIELVEGPDTYQCEIDLGTGSATLWAFPTPGAGEDGIERTKIATGQTAMSGSGVFDVCMANVDDRVCLWVDGSLVDFDGSTEFECSDVPLPTTRDLAPIGVGISGAEGTVSGLVVKRDIYYRNDIIEFSKDDRSFVQGSLQPVPEVSRGYELQQSLSSPETWSTIYNEASAENNYRYGQFGEYVLAEDEYLMFGDNSSMSKDSRLFDYESRPRNGVFSNRFAVREKDLIGKALFIFWPHGVPFLRDGKGIPVWYHKGHEDADPRNYPSVRAPFYPNFHRMKKIR